MVKNNNKENRIRTCKPNKSEKQRNKRGIIKMSSVIIEIKQGLNYYEVKDLIDAIDNIKGVNHSIILSNSKTGFILEMNEK